MAPTAVPNLSLRRSGLWALAQGLVCLPLLALACEGDLSSDDDSSDVTPADGGPMIGDSGTEPGVDGGPRPDGSTPDDPDLGPPDPDGVPIFVAQGHMGRTTVSCDDGRSWTNDTSMDDAVRCFTDGFDCDHHPGSAKGLAWSPRDGGHFYATYGWGPPGSVRRSTDGVTWDPRLEETTFGGLAYGNDVLLAGSRNARRSTDGGDTFEDGVDTGLMVWNVRRTGFAGGRFVLVGEDGGERDVVWSTDGATWDRPSTLPGECGGGIQNTGGIVDLGGSIVIVGGDGVACVSSDDGDTFSSTTIRDGVTSHAVSHGGEVFVWSRGEVHRSSDGSDWSSSATAPSDLLLGAVAVSDDGTFVGVRGGWQNWYENQEFYRSEDGVTWETLGDGSFTGSHPIRDIQFGRVPACP
ncbi:MAG: hypothetical protein JJ863_02565 [Deltaproteobacteria bacterium]|nr:hypothetical protein [Deltaproteobacteria bacterium]